MEHAALYHLRSIGYKIHLPVKSIKAENVGVNSLAPWKIYPFRSAKLCTLFPAATLIHNTGTHGASVST